jgi:apolipoprotein N-acyltransferase
MTHYTPDQIHDLIPGFRTPDRARYHGYRPTNPTMIKINLFLRITFGLTLAAFSAGLLLLALPPYGIWPFALIGLVPMLFAQYRILSLRLANLAPAIGIGGFIGLVILSYFPTALIDASPFLKFLTPGVMLVVYFTESGTRRFHERTHFRWFVLEGAVIWVGIELIRGLTVGTGGFIGYAFYRTPLLVQPISIFGIYGLSLLAMLIDYALALLLIALYDCATINRPASLDRAGCAVSLPLARRWSIGLGVIALIWIALGAVLYQTPTTSRVTVAAVQPHTPTVPNLARGTRAAVLKGAQIVVWPEGALSYDPRQRNSDVLQRLARDNHVYLVIGFGLRAPGGLYNQVIVVSPQGEFLGTYGKTHPVSYVGETSLAHHGYPVFDTPLGKLGAIICYDLAFADTARDAVRNGAQIIAAPSNDWPELYDKEYVMPMYRAIENRVAVIKADTQYDSVIVDPYGRVLSLSSSAQGKEALGMADVPIGTADTPQIIWGDGVGWLCLIGLIVFMLHAPIAHTWRHTRVHSVLTKKPPEG